MNSDQAVLGILFDTNKIDDGDYKIECWKILWKVLQLDQFINKPVSLHEGVIQSQGEGSNETFCIAISCSELNAGVIKDVKFKVAMDDDFKKVAASPRFLEGKSLWNSPLLKIGEIDYLGAFVGVEDNAATIALRNVEATPQSIRLIITTNSKDMVPTETNQPTQTELCWFCRRNNSSIASSVAMRFGFEKMEQSGKKIYTRRGDETIFVPRCSPCEDYHSSTKIGSYMRWFWTTTSILGIGVLLLFGRFIIVDFFEIDPNFWNVPLAGFLTVGWIILLAIYYLHTLSEIHLGLYPGNKINKKISKQSNYFNSVILAFFIALNIGFVIGTFVTISTILIVSISATVGILSYILTFKWLSTKSNERKQRITQINSKYYDEFRTLPELENARFNYPPVKNLLDNGWNMVME